MVYQRKCSKCRKEISSGKFYNFYTGKKGGKSLTRYKNKEFFCPSCAEQEKVEWSDDGNSSSNLLEVEWEIGNQTDEEILEFEEKIWKFRLENEFRSSSPDVTLDLLQKYRQEFDPYLQKLNILGQSFGGRIKDCGSFQVFAVLYLFAKSARDENYRKEVVEPTIAEILGVEKLEQKINTVSQKSHDDHGYTSGKLEINGNEITYQWADGEAGDCRRISFGFWDHKLFLQALCRALKIKEKELKGDNSPTQPEKDNSEKPEKNNNIEPNQKIIKQYFLSNDFRLVQLNDDNSLMTLYYENKNKSSKKTPKHKNKSEWTAEEKHIESYLKKHNKKFLTRTEINNWTDVETSNQPKVSSNSTSWPLIISLFIIGIIFLGGLVYFLRIIKREK